MKKKVVSMFLILACIFSIFSLFSCAQYSPNDSYVESADIKYVMYGGTNDESNPTTVYSNNKFPIELATPIRDGYDFMGWYSNGKIIKSIDSCTSLVVYAIWNEKKSEDDKLSIEEVVEIVETYQKASFNSAEEMFQSDLANGYLDYFTNGEFTIYVNRYTGVMYYRNNATGEMLTSNTYNFSDAFGYVDKLASQVYVSYATLSSTENVMNLYSSFWAAKFNQINVSQIEAGLRVSYVIGDTSTRCLLPVIIEAHTLEEDILKPMFELLYAKMIENLDQDPNKSYAINYYDESGKYYVAEKVYKENYIHQKSIRSYTRDFENIIAEYEQYLIDNAKVTGGLTIANIAKINEVEAIMGAINTVFNAYQPYNNVTAENFDPLNTPEICLEGVAVYKVKDSRYSQMRHKANLIKKYCLNYTFEMMYEAEKFCGYEYQYKPTPVFECYIEYKFNDDGSISAILYPDTVVYNNVDYTVEKFEYLNYIDEKYITDDGRIYLPSEMNSIN